MLTDLTRIAPCMPGATLTGQDGHEFQGRVKLRIGPINVEYLGSATFVERDDKSHHAVIHAKGSDPRGGGKASATVTVHLEVIDEGTTRVDLQTDLDISGKAAQFGRGIMADVSEKILRVFVENLERIIDESSNLSLTEIPPQSVSSTFASRDDALDLGALTGFSVAKHILPAAVAVLAAVVLLMKLLLD